MIIVQTLLDAKNVKLRLQNGGRYAQVVVDSKVFVKRLELFNIFLNDFDLINKTNEAIYFYIAGNIKQLSLKVFLCHKII